MSLKLLAISGSLRLDSFNRKLLQLANKMASQAGAEVSELDLSDLDLPIYNQDIQDAGLPDSVKQLKTAIEAVDALLIASPEYNYSISGVLKNAFDWGSRAGNSWHGKTAVIMGVSNGSYGTVRGQLHLREILVDLDVLVLPKPIITIGNGAEAFTPNGDLVNIKSMNTLQELIQKTLAITPAFQKIALAV